MYRSIATLPDIEAHLVTQVRNREAIVRAGLREGEDFTAIDTEALARRVYQFASLVRGGKNKGWTTVTALSALIYPYFERRVWRQFGEAIRSGEYDVVHRLTPVSPTAPSPIARRCAKAGVPFVAGPLNGGVPWPEAFDAARRREREWLSYVRGGYKLLPGYRGTREHAAALLIGSRATWDQMPKRYHAKCHYVPENAIDPTRFPSPQARPTPGSPLTAAFVGRLVPYKGADMLLEAAAELASAGRLRLDLYGDGPELPALHQQVERLGIGSAVTLHGFVPHGELQGRLAKADVFAFPSIREFGGAVVLEAMALGVVPIVVNYGGPGELVGDQTGYRVPIGTRASIVSAFRDRLAALCDDPQELVAKAEVAQRFVQERFTWHAKARQVEGIYRGVIDGADHVPADAAASPRSLETPRP